MTSPNAIQNVEPSRSAIQYFQTTYPALVSAFNQAMGEVSQGVSNIDPLGGQKTATEVRSTTRQQQVRDQKNQVDLGEALSDMMSMWLSNNKQFLLSDKKKQSFILRIVGKQQYDYYKRAGLDQMELTDEATSEIAGIISNQEGNINPMDIDQLVEAGKTPRFPVKMGDSYGKKMTVNDMGDGAEVSVVPEDLDGFYDYVPSVASMALGADEIQMQARQGAIDDLKDPSIQKMLMEAGVKPSIKQILIDKYEGSGLNDAEKYFEDIPQQPPMGGGIMGNGQESQIAQPGSGVLPGSAPVGPGGPMPAGIDPSLANQAPQPMAGPQGMQGQPGL
jgi:hypothetical protein